MGLLWAFHPLRSPPWLPPPNRLGPVRPTSSQPRPHPSAPLRAHITRPIYRSYSNHPILPFSVSSSLSYRTPTCSSLTLRTVSEPRPKQLLPLLLILGLPRRLIPVTLFCSDSENWMRLLTPPMSSTNPISRFSFITPLSSHLPLSNHLNDIRHKIYNLRSYCSVVA